MKNSEKKKELLEITALINDCDSALDTFRECGDFWLSEIRHFQTLIPRLENFFDIHNGIMLEREENILKRLLEKMTIEEIKIELDWTGEYWDKELPKLVKNPEEISRYQYSALVELATEIDAKDNS